MKHIRITLLVIFLALAPSIAALAGGFAVQHRKGAAPQHYYIKTQDGWRLSIYRYKPAVVKEGSSPVILCHGIHFNSNFWDLDDSHSFARYLCGNGYDVWNVNLRGAGDSSKPLIAEFRSLSKLQISNWPNVLKRLPTSVLKFNWTLDDHVDKDLPAIINSVRKETGKDKITWIGHSMGGMVMYGYLEKYDQGPINGFAALGSTMCVPETLTRDIILQNMIIPMGARQASLLVNTTIASQIRTITLGTLKLPWEDRFYNFENMDRQTTIRIFRRCISDISRGVAAQYVNMVEHGNLLSYDGKYDYAKNVDKVTAPLLVTVAPKDPFGSMANTMCTFDRVSSREKELVSFSKDNGYSIDYGHCDVILGKRAAEEVFPVLLDWIERRR